jgi:hypothetical protein
MSLRYKCILQYSSRVCRLPRTHPCSEDWLSDLVIPEKSQHYCRPFVTESHEVLTTTKTTLPSPNSQLITNSANHDTSIFLAGRFGTPLRDCRRSYDGQAAYLSSTSLTHIRVRARLRLDVAQLNHPMHKRNKAPSPNCSCQAGVEETRVHALMLCPIYNAARNELVASLSNPNDFNLSYILDAITPATTKFLLEVNRSRHLYRFNR